MSEENNWNYGNDEPNVNQGNPVSLEKSTTDGTAGVNLEKTVTGNEERVNPEKTMTMTIRIIQIRHMETAIQIIITDSQMTVQVITMDSQTAVQIIIMDSQMAITSQKVKDLVLRR